MATIQIRGTPDEATTCHAPHLLGVEAGHVPRRRERAGQITADQGLTALLALSRPALRRRGGRSRMSNA